MTSSDRRQFLTLLSALPAFSCGTQHPISAPTAAPNLSAAFQLLEGSGRLGVAFLDTANGEVVGHRLDEAFPLCSTFKLPLAAMVLRAVDRGQLRLDAVLPYSKADLIPHTPITAAHVSEGGLSVEALAQAAQMQSDNLAANLLLKQLGGPAAFTAFCRELGDPVTRLDRTEPMLNLSTPGDPRDTTTPRAMAQLVQTIVGKSVLSPSSLSRLQNWMLSTETGAKRLRAGMPKHWIVGDKTGTQLGAGFSSSNYNDVACAWFPNRGPLLVAAYYVAPYERTSMHDADQLVLARVGNLAAQWLTARVRA
jgi:beta-lactamase class A